ncbi:MAG: molybdenum cofactor guanylyltransferase [Spirochaetaceae bacterium]|nr:molybdenum cofactor guanylyltransferase [Spirochaetaceae bacterium]
MDAAVLAGGRGSRMNFRDKSQLTYRGNTFLNTIVTTLRKFNRILIISNRDKTTFPDIHMNVYKDIISDIGPLGGIYTALKNAASQQIFVTSCDMPLIKEEHIDTICAYSEYDIVIPVYKGKYEMLFALYSKNCLPQIEKLIGEKQYKLTGLFEDKGLKVKKVPVDQKFIASLKNINTEQDYSVLTENIHKK